MPFSHVRGGARIVVDHSSPGDAVPKDSHNLHHRVLGMRLQRARDAAGLTQEAVADQLGSSMKEVSRHEAGTRRTDLFEAAEFARIYGISLVDLAAEPSAEETAELASRSRRAP
jgi:ribosome-binding protein aMBF1 (putative translation factor)